MSTTYKLIAHKNGKTEVVSVTKTSVAFALIKAASLIVKGFKVFGFFVDGKLTEISGSLAVRLSAFIANLKKAKSVIKTVKAESKIIIKDKRAYSPELFGFELFRGVKKTNVFKAGDIYAFDRNHWAEYGNGLGLSGTYIVYGKVLSISKYSLTIMICGYMETDLPLFNSGDLCGYRPVDGLIGEKKCIKQWNKVYSIIAA